MADEFYRRLGCAHAKPVFAESGRERSACYSCRPRGVRKERTKLSAGKRNCQRCGLEFDAKPSQKNCSASCRDGTKLTRDEWRQSVARKTHRCEWCKTDYTPWASKNPKHVTRWCSRRCQREHRGRLGQERAAERPRFSLWFAFFCCVCGKPEGSRSRYAKHCASCARDVARAAANAARLEDAIDRHRAEGRVLSCASCAIEFCPLYGASNMRLCLCCKTKRFRESVAVSRAKGKARKRTLAIERVDPEVVLSRDNWKCYLCGVDTPRALRGSLESNAPEVEHVIPLARGGAHSYDNTRCACRACNAAKSDSIGWAGRSAPSACAAL